MIFTEPQYRGGRSGGRGQNQSESQSSYVDDEMKSKYERYKSGQSYREPDYGGVPPAPARNSSRRRSRDGKIRLVWVGYDL